MVTYCHHSPLAQSAKTRAKIKGGGGLFFFFCWGGHHPRMYADVATTITPVCHRHQRRGAGPATGSACLQIRPITSQQSGPVFFGSQRFHQLPLRAFVAQNRGRSPMPTGHQQKSPTYRASYRLSVLVEADPGTLAQLEIAPVGLGTSWLRKKPPLLRFSFCWPVFRPVCRDRANSTAQGSSSKATGKAG